MITETQRLTFVAAVPGFDVTVRGCHTAWLPVGTVKLSDDGPGLMIEFHEPVAAEETVYLRWLPDCERA